MHRNILFIFLALLLNLSVAFTQSKGLNIGDMAPDIKLPDPNGKIISLYSLRDKVVLVDFWGTWCSPCVKEQTELAALYKKYRNSAFTNGNGFEIYGVSLDNKKKAWQAIIKKYNISWIQVSDLLFWTSPVAKDYDIQELPFNVLIDGKGVIIAKNLHEAELEEAIRGMLKN